MANKDQLPFATGSGETKNPSGGASGGHDFTLDPKDHAPKTGGGYLAKDRPQQMGEDDTVNKESEVPGGRLPFHETKFEDAGVKGTGSVGNSKRPFRVSGG